MDGRMRTITDREVFVPVTLITGGFLTSFYVYRAYLRRIPNSRRIPDSFYHRRTMLGRVTSVGDADNFHFYHTPGGVFGGWGWLRQVPKHRKELSNNTIHVRLCGIDAPEGAHFGKPSQKWSKEALEWLRGKVLGRKVRVLPLAPDQYMRTVAETRMWTLTGRKNISKEMLKSGWAMVYESKTGCEFNGHEDEFRQLEAKAKSKRMGMFQDKKFITPGEFKRMHKD